MNMTEIDTLRAEICQLLRSWINGNLTERDVHESAEELLSDVGWDIFPKNDSRSIIMEVLSRLDVLNQELVTADDVPAMIEFLEAKPGTEKIAWQEWDDYWNNVDLDARKKSLKDNKYYAV